MKRLTIPGRLPGLNELIDANRGSHVAGARMKRDTDATVGWAITARNLGKLREPVRLHFHWFEPDKRRDPDNIAAAKKFVLDALVKAGCLAGDGWGGVAGFTDAFAVDKASPRVVVTFEEDTA